MGKLSKFENVDVIASLEAIMKQNTAFYQSDFEIDNGFCEKQRQDPLLKKNGCYGFPARRGRAASGNATFS